MLNKPRQHILDGKVDILSKCCIYVLVCIERVTCLYILDADLVVTVNDMAKINKCFNQIIIYKNNKNTVMRKTNKTRHCHGNASYYIGKVEIVLVITCH